MIKKFSLDAIQDEEVRAIVSADLGDMSQRAAQELHWLQSQPEPERRAIHISAEPAHDRSWDAIPAEARAPKAKQSMKKAVWNILCNVKADDPTKGEPDAEAKKIFTKDGIGKEIIEAALVAAIAALGGVWAGLAAAIASSLGKKIEDYVIGLVISQLDKAYTNQLGKFCEFVPKE